MVEKLPDVSSPLNEGILVMGNLDIALGFCFGHVVSIVRLS